MKKILITFLGVSFSVVSFCQKNQSTSVKSSNGTIYYNVNKGNSDVIQSPPTQNTDIFGRPK